MKRKFFLLMVLCILIAALYSPVRYYPAMYSVKAADESAKAYYSFDKPVKDITANSTNNTEYYLRLVPPSETNDPIWVTVPQINDPIGISPGDSD